MTQEYIITEDELNLWQTVSSMSPMQMELRQKVRSRPYTAASGREQVLEEVRTACIKDESVGVTIFHILQELRQQEGQR